MNNLIQSFINKHGEFIKNLEVINEEEWKDLLLEDPLIEIGLNEGNPEPRETLKNKKINPESLQKKAFDIIKVHFPYEDNENLVDFRPVLVVPYEENKFKYMMITKGERTNIIYRRYEVKLDKWKEAGLKKPSFVRVNRIVNEDMLEFTTDSYHIGHLSEDEIVKVSQMFDVYKSEMLTHPIGFLDFLVSNKVTDTQHERGNNNYCSIQTVDDIKNSLEANCVDIAIVSYKMAKAAKDIPQATIGNVKWIINSRKSQGHVFMVFRYKGASYVFDYDQVHCIGKFRYYRAGLLTSVKWFASNIKKEHPDEEVRKLPPNRVRIKMLNEEELKTIDHISDYKTQKDWLIDVGFYKPQDYGEVDKQGLKEFYEWLEKKDPISYALMEWCCK